MFLQPFLKINEENILYAMFLPRGNYLRHQQLIVKCKNKVQATFFAEHSYDFNNEEKGYSKVHFEPQVNKLMQVHDLCMLYIEIYFHFGPIAKWLF